MGVNPDTGHSRRASACESRVVETSTLVEANLFVLGSTVVARTGIQHSKRWCAVLAAHECKKGATAEDE